MSPVQSRKPTSAIPSRMRARKMTVITAAVAALLLVPLLVVWKQAYIRSSSVGLERMADTLSKLDKEINQLTFKAEQLAATGRIENVARETLGLEYPAADRLVIVSRNGKKDSPRTPGSEIGKGGRL